MLLALLPAAYAVDLEARITTPAGDVKSLTFHDVDTSAPPALQFETGGATVRLTLAVTPAGDTWQVAATLSDVDKKGRTRLLSAPTLTVHENEEGVVRQGARIAIPGSTPTEYREQSWELAVWVRPA